MKTQKNPKDQIVEGAIAHLDAKGPPFASYAHIAEASDVSRQLTRYYFPEPDALMLDVCDTLYEAYRQALAQGAQLYDGVDKLQFILDFYFEDVDATLSHTGCSDAMVAYASGNSKIKSVLRDKYILMGQALQLEIKVAYPDMPLRSCSEMAYMCLCILQGNLKLTSSIGISADHSKIARKAIDTLLSAAQSETAAPSSAFEVWS